MHLVWGEPARATPSQAPPTGSRVDCRCNNASGLLIDGLDRHRPHTRSRPVSLEFVGCRCGATRH